MNILSFDTSTRAASVAIMKDDELVGELIINDKRTHSQKLMPMLENLMNLADMSIDDIDLLAVCVGPGSFTGLRIAMATVKAMAHAKNLNIVEVDSLEGLAHNVASSSKKIIPILDAQGNMLYTSSYRSEGGRLIALSDIELVDMNDLIDRIEEEGEQVIVIGEGISKANELLDRPLIEIAQYEKNVSRASSIAAIAREKYTSSIGVHSCYDILPMYIRKSQAEVQYEEKIRKRQG